MQTFATGQSQDSAAVESLDTGSAVGRKVVAVAAIGALWFVLWRHLSSEWSINEQYNYGWFVPFFSVFLFALRWEDRPGKERGRTGAPHSSFFLLSTLKARPLLHIRYGYFLLLALLLPIRLFELGNPDWRPLGWLHAVAVIALTFLWIWNVGGPLWVRHFAFPICFTLVALPWISAIETPVIQGLMHGVAGVAAETLNLFGVPARLEGNLIRVSTGLVGVNEACSGVRSLQTSLMIGLLFGELKRLTLTRRLTLIAGALAIALLANCIRALILVWLAATRSADSVSRWHDLAGYSIVVLVFLGTLIFSSLLSRGKPVVSEKPKPLPDRDVFGIPILCSLAVLGWIVCVEIAAAGWYRFHERDLIQQAGWQIKWPDHASGYRKIPIEEGVRRTLRFDDGSEARWNLVNDERNPASVFAFFFRWNSGGSSVVRARAHRPDICLPSVGWEMTADNGVAQYRVGDLSLPFRRAEFRKPGSDVIAYTFFCLQEDQRHPAESRPDLKTTDGTQPDWSYRGRTAAVKNGVRNFGQQVLEIILLSPAPLESDAIEKQFSHLLGDLIVPKSPEPRG